MLIACPVQFTRGSSLEMQHTKVIISRDILSLYIQASFGIIRGCFKFCLNRSAISLAKTSAAFGKFLS